MDPVRVSEKQFHDLVSRRARTFLGLACYLAKCDSPEKIMVRPLLGELLSKSMQLEELLDAYDARNNCRWCSFRGLTAAVKAFSHVGYELLHIQHSLPDYQLIPIKLDFPQATRQAILFCGHVLLRISHQFLETADSLNLNVPSETSCEQAYTEELPNGRLPHDCNMKRVETVGETVTMLSTAFLNLAAESENIHSVNRIEPHNYNTAVDQYFGEENLRSLQLRFHNLQSLYDTYVSGTEAEHLDKDLPVLRGHISVVFHLLKTAVGFAHYYERHVNKATCNSPSCMTAVVSSQELLAMLMEYSLLFTSRYITCTEHLCQEMLKRYREIGQVEVEVPHYRGFHVRPATLISKLVLHYGSQVKMELDGEIYDAGSSLELFRANEKINAHKRRWLASEIDRLGLVPEQADPKSIKAIVKVIVLTLAEQGKIILYEQPLQLPEKINHSGENVLDRVIAEVSRLLTIGKIDVDTNMTAKFRGDKRVLADIKRLAENGYGEDNFGNNIPLPKELAFLRRQA